MCKLRCSSLVFYYDSLVSELFIMAREVQGSNFVASKLQFGEVEI